MTSTPTNSSALKAFPKWWSVYNLQLYQSVNIITTADANSNEAKVDTYLPNCAALPYVLSIYSFFHSKIFVLSIYSPNCAATYMYFPYILTDFLCVCKNRSYKYILHLVQIYVKEICIVNLIHKLVFCLNIWLKICF